MARSTGNPYVRRRGVTLLEVLLVLGLLVVIGALAAPSVGITLDSHRLRNGGEIVRVQLAKARVKAMESGRTYTFRYQPGGNACLIEPWYSMDDYLEASLDDLSGGPAAMPQAMAAPNMASSNPQTLPETVTFVGSETNVDARAAVLMQSSAAPQALDGAWSQPIFFYPDGTSSTARLVITNVRNRFITLTLRGLTGVVRVSQPSAGSEVLQ